MADKPPPPVGLGSLAIPAFKCLATAKRGVAAPAAPPPAEIKPASVLVAKESEPLKDLAVSAAPIAVSAVAGLALGAVAEKAGGEEQAEAAAEEKTDKLLKPVWLRFDINPTDSKVIDDTFTLSSVDGSYSQTQTVANDLIPGDTSLDLEYKDLDPKLEYSLKVDPGASGAPYYVFKKTPFTRLAALNPPDN